MSHLSIYLTPHQKQLLKLFCFLKGVSEKEVIKEIIEKNLEKIKEEDIKKMKRKGFVKKYELFSVPSDSRVWRITRINIDKVLLNKARDIKKYKKIPYNVLWYSFFKREEEKLLEEVRRLKEIIDLIEEDVKKRAGDPIFVKNKE